VDRFFARWGSFAVFMRRFVPFIRGVVGIPAGIAEMPLVPFYLWTFCGSLIFCGGFVLLGSSLGSHAGAVGEAFRKFSILIAVVAIAAVALCFIVKSWLKKRGSPSKTRPE
jgi:membrane protein DedA with SNARE-associated domain